MTVTLCLVLLMLGSTPSGLSEGTLGRVWFSLPHLVSTVWNSNWQLHREFPSAPLGRVWPSLPHLVSSVWNSTGNCFGTPNSTELNNNSTPTRSPTGSLNRMFNRHQAEITVMQFRGYSLPVHHLGIVFLGRVEGQNITSATVFPTPLQRRCSPQRYTLRHIETLFILLRGTMSC